MSTLDLRLHQIKVISWIQLNSTHNSVLLLQADFALLIAYQQNFPRLPSVCCILKNLQDLKPLYEHLFALATWLKLNLKEKQGCKEFFKENKVKERCLKPQNLLAAARGAPLPVKKKCKHAEMQYAFTHRKAQAGIPSALDSNRASIDE